MNTLIDNIQDIELLGVLLETQDAPKANIKHVTLALMRIRAAVHSALDTLIAIQQAECPHETKVKLSGPDFTLTYCLACGKMWSAEQETT